MFSKGPTRFDSGSNQQFVQLTNPKMKKKMKKKKKMRMRMMMRMRRNLLILLNVLRNCLFLWKDHWV